MSAVIPVVKSRRRRSRAPRNTFGFAPSASTDIVAINIVLTASEAYYWVPLRGANNCVCRPSSMLIRAAASAPSNLRFFAEISDDNTTWREIWSSNTGLVGTNSLLIKLKIPKLAGRAIYARLGAISSGTPTLCGQATFVYYDPA